MRASRGVLKDRIDLCTGHAGKPCEELLDGCPTFEILKKRADRYARTAEHPGAAELPGIPLHRRTGRPIKHCLILRSRRARGWAFRLSSHLPERAGINCGDEQDGARRAARDAAACYFCCVPATRLAGFAEVEPGLQLFEFLAQIVGVPGLELVELEVRVFVEFVAGGFHGSI